MDEPVAVSSTSAPAASPASSDFIVHFPSGRSWASQLVEAFASRRIDAGLMWELLLAHADDARDPDIANLLEHLDEDAAVAREAARKARIPTADDWFVMAEDDGVGAA